MKLKNQLLISHVLLSVVPLLIITAFFYIKLLDTFSVTMAESAEILVDQSANNFDILIEEAEKAARTLSHEIVLIQALRERPELSSYDAYRIRINRWMKNLHNYSTPRLDAFYVLGEYQVFSSNDADITENIWKEADWYRRVVERDGPVWFPSHAGSFVGEETEAVLSMATTIHDSLNGDLLGVILIDIEEEEFRQIANSSMADNLRIQVMDGTGEQVYQAGQDQGYSNAGSSFLSSGNLQFTQELINGWRIRAEVQAGKLAFERAFSMMGILTALIVLMILAAFAVSFRLAEAISRPVIALRNAFHKLESGDFDVETDEKTRSQEMLALNRSFNRMTGNLKELMDRVVLNEKRLREAQIAALNAQINPHFLYNTLDTIAWNVRLSHNQDALEALYALTKLFRISISKGQDVIRLEQEFEHARMYLILQSMRYSDILDYKIDLPEELQECCTIKLLLQPLVENSIYHGIKEAERRGTIEVTAYEENGSIVLKVYDNGAGMKKEALEHLNSLLKQGVKTDKKVFGVLNVNLRLKMAYGEEYGIFYESAENCFTCAYVRIPRYVEEDNSDSRKNSR